MIKREVKELSERHKVQVNAMIGKKVSIYIAHRKIKRILKEDDAGLYILYKGSRVPCRPDPHTENVLYFIASEPRRKG